MTSKNVPKLRLRGFEDNWNNKKLSNVLHERTEKEPETDEYPLKAFISGVGVSSKGDRYDRSALVKEKNKKYKITKLHDFIYSSNNFITGSIGLNWYGNATISPVYSIFYTKNNSSPYFINYLAKNNLFLYKMSKYQQGVTYGQRRIKEKDFLNIIEPIPSLPEQQHIGNFFSKLDHLIDLHSQKLEQLKKLKRGYLQKMFPQKGEMVPRLRFNGFSDDWKKIKLNTLLKVGKSGGTPSTKKKKYYQGDIPFLSIKDVTGSNGVVTSTEKHITEEGLKNSSSWIVPSGALTLSMYASVGEVAKFGMDISTSQAFFNMIFNKKTSSAFMYYYLKEFNLSGSWNRLIATGTQSNLNANSIKSAVLKIPSVDEQEKIYIFLNHLDNLINENSDMIEELNRQKKAYLQKMFI